MKRELDLILPGNLDAPSLARLAVDGLAGHVPPGVLEDVRLLVSELVTNSVRHAGLSLEDSVRLRVVTTLARIRVEVTDPGPGFEPAAARPPTVDQSSGWGLYIVDRIANRWNVARDGGTRVWFEIDCEPEDPGARDRAASES